MMNAQIWGIRYPKADVKQDYKPRKNSEAPESFLKSGKDWKEFYIVCSGGDENDRK